MSSEVTTSFPLWRKTNSILTTMIYNKKKIKEKWVFFKAWNVPLDITRRHLKLSLKQIIPGGACTRTPRSCNCLRRPFDRVRACVLTPTPGLETESSYCLTPTFFRARNTGLHVTVTYDCFHLPLGVSLSEMVICFFNFNHLSAGIDLRRQNLKYTDFRFWRNQIGI